MPIIDFLDFYLIKSLPLFNFLPMQRLNLTIFGLLPLFMLWDRRLKIHGESYWLLILVFFGIILSLNPILIIILTTHLLFVFLVLKNTKRLDIIYYYLLGYFAISALSFFVRIFIYNTPLFLARGGMNIWGGLTLSTILFLGHLLFNDNKLRSDVLLFLSMTTAILFISRSAIIVIGIYIVFYKLPKRTLIMVTLIILMALVLFQNFFNDLAFFQFLFKRFELIDGSTLESSRLHIWEDSIAIIMSRLGLPVGIGNYVMYSYRSYSNAHDFILTLVTEMSFIATGVLYYLLRVLLLSLRNRTFVGLIFVFSLMSLGVPLWQVGGDVSFILLLLFTVYFEEKSPRNDSTAFC